MTPLSTNPRNSTSPLQPTFSGLVKSINPDRLVAWARWAAGRVARKGPEDVHGDPNDRACANTTITSQT